MSDFIVKDSGARQQFASGMVRDVTTGKADFSLVYDGPMLDRWAAHLTKGADKYTARNWMRASGPAELERFRASAARHFAQWMRGDTDEDHAAAVLFNINGAEYVAAMKAAAPVIRCAAVIEPPGSRRIHCDAPAGHDGRHSAVSDAGHRTTWSPE